MAFFSCKADTCRGRPPKPHKNLEKMTKKKVRVSIPRNADKMIELADDIIAEHVALGTGSPLSGLDMTAFAAKVAAAKTKNTLQKTLRKDAETATEDRDDLLGKKKDQNTSTPGTVLNFIVRSRDVLLGAHKGNEQHLGDFGFEVAQSGSGGTGGGGGGTPATTGNVSGTVTHAVTMTPVVGASVEVVGTGIVGTTDAFGKFNLTNVSVGPHVLRVSALGSANAEVPFTVAAGTTVMVNVSLTPAP